MNRLTVRIAPDRHVQQRKIVLGNPGGVIDCAWSEFAPQQVLHRQSHPRRVPVAG